MTQAIRDFQVFVKPAGAACNLACDYCYYLPKEDLFKNPTRKHMPTVMLERYIRRQIEATPTRVIRFSWHGGEPTLLGLDYFRRITALQRKYQPPGRPIVNGIQTNGTLLDAEWCRFLSEENFVVGLSLDGPRDLHDGHRRDKVGRPTFNKAMQGFDLLQIHNVNTDILCVVTAQSVLEPERLYRFFKEIGAPFISLLPLVIKQSEPGSPVSNESVPAEAFGGLLCTLFDEWRRHDIGQIKVEIFEEAARTALGLEPAVCIFRPTCGDVPVVERNGDFFACDHFVDRRHRIGNIRQTPLAELLEDPAQRAFGSSKQKNLPRFCRNCPVLNMCNGGCPKDRFVSTPEGEPGLNYLCPAYKQFFTHCRPFLTTLRELQQNLPS